MPTSKKKKVVRVESTPSGDAPERATWKPTDEAKAKATRLRLIAGGLWALAIAGEAAAVFGVLQQDPVKMWLLILLIVVIGALAIGGSLLWKQANRLDPASREDTFRFFVQNQLGAIVTVIAFLPLIILIFLNKDLDGKQKAIAGGIGIVVAVIAGFIGTSTDSPSVEDYSEKTQEVVDLTGQDLVFWTKEGDVYHLCSEASAVNLESEDNQIYSGRVADALADGKERLTLQVDQEMRQCGFDTANAAGAADVDDSTAVGDDSVAQEQLALDTEPVGSTA